LYLCPKFLNFGVLFFKHKITNFWELLLYYRKKFNSFDINNTYKDNNSNRTIGKHNKTKDTNGEPISGYHDHEIGHTFDRTPHFNAWSESTGTSFKNNVHLYYE
jgi:hypothetical protein